MPAAAVIPAPVAYIKVVAVKKLVVGFLIGCSFPPSGERQRLFILLLTILGIHLPVLGSDILL